MKPILFNTAMVQAILEGRKTQTRRVVKLLTKDPDEWEADNFVRERAAKEYCKEYAAGCWPCFVKRQEEFHTAPKNEVRCIYYPKYVDGDIIYIRETWAPFGVPQYLYKANDDGTAEKCGLKWRPSIHMPKEAARLFLRVTNVRAERLQDISETDAIAEGIVENFNRLPSAIFADLWDSVYGAGSWDVNPWVWVYEFERVAKSEALC